MSVNDHLHTNSPSNHDDKNNETNCDNDVGSYHCYGKCDCVDSHDDDLDISSP